MKTLTALISTLLVGTLAFMGGCNNKEATEKTETAAELSDYQNTLINEGWYLPKEKLEGELATDYGVKSKYGQQDNYFDIEIGNGCDVAIKIMDVTTDKCIRYVFVPENSTANVQMIPQGKYYLKFAYGKDWMEYENGDGTLSAKFTSNVSYDKSTDIFDFGKKNSDLVVNYYLSINVVPDTKNTLTTVTISEDEFMK